jgi:iron complex transport system substrate-binding protein
MHKGTRLLLPAAALSVTALALTACSTPGASEDAAEAAELSTVVIENAKPTLVLVEEDGKSSYQEDLEVARDSVQVEANPASVVTFDIATLDTLHAIGAGDAVVGIPDAVLPDYLAEYAELPKVGTLFEPDFEAVAELEPELIVTAARSTGQYDELSEIATTIDLTGAYAGTFDPSAGLERAAQLGEIFGKEDEVAELTAGIDELVSTIESDAEGTALVLSVSGGEVGAFGEGSRFGYFFDELGWTPAVVAAELPGAEGSPHGDTVTNEFILTANPDWIFAFDRGAATGEGSSAEETLDNELVAQTTAAQDDHIVYLPASELYIVINGLTAIENVLTSVHEAIAG